MYVIGCVYHIMYGLDPGYFGTAGILMYLLQSVKLDNDPAQLVWTKHLSTLPTPVVEAFLFKNWKKWQTINGNPMKLQIEVRWYHFSGHIFWGCSLTSVPESSLKLACHTYIYIYITCAPRSPGSSKGSKDVRNSAPKRKQTLTDRKKSEFGTKHDGHVSLAGENGQLFSGAFFLWANRPSSRQGRNSSRVPWLSWFQRGQTVACLSYR